MNTTAQATATPIEEPAEASRASVPVPVSVLLAMVFAGLISVLPYAAGYGEQRMTLWRWLCIAWSNATWQHGALAAPLAAFLVWRRRGQLAQIEIKPSNAGLALIVFSLALYWTGYRGNFYYLGYASIQLLAAGVILWLWGWRHFKKTSFAWLILGFAWPYLFLEDTLAFKLRYLMVTCTGWVLNHTGLSTMQDGTTLISDATSTHAQGDLFSLNVDGPCSGMRSLFALLMVGALIGYFRQRSWWRRTIVFLMSVPLAVVANMLRILVLVAGSMLFGQKFAVGHGEEYTSNFHLFSGIAVFSIAFAGLMETTKWLNKLCGYETPQRLSEN